MVASQQVQPAGQHILCSMDKAVSRFARDDAGIQKVGEVAVKGDFAEAYYDFDARENLDLAGEMLGAVADLLRKGFVAGRGASNDGGDPDVAEFEAVVARDSFGFIGETEVMQDGIHEGS